MLTDRGSPRFALALVCSLVLLASVAAAAEQPANSVVVVRPHARQSPDLAIDETQEAMLARIDTAIVRADADKNPILAQATIVPGELVDNKITELAIGSRLGEDRCAEGLARSLQADSYLRVEVVGIEGPFTEMMVAPQPSPPATPPPAAEPPQKDKRGRKGAAPGDKAASLAPPLSAPVVPSGDEKWTVRYRFTLLPAEVGAVLPEEFTIEREVEGVIRNAARSHVIALLERLKTTRATGGLEVPGRRKWIALGVVGLVVGAAAAGAGGYLLSLDGKPTEELVFPARHTPQRYATIVPASVALGGGALVLAGGVAALVRGLRGGGERSSSIEVGPVCTMGSGVGGGIAVSGAF